MSSHVGTNLTKGAVIGSFLSAAAIVGLSSSITVWQRNMGLDGAQVGLLSGLLSMAIAVGSLGATPLQNRFGRIGIYRTSLLLTAVSFAVCAVAPNFPVLLIGVMFSGFFTGFDLPVSLSLVSDTRYTGENNVRQISLTQSGWQLGIFVIMGFAFLISFIPGNIGDRSTYAFLTLIALLAGIYRIVAVRFTTRELEHEAEDCGTKTVRPDKNNSKTDGRLFWKTFDSQHLALFFGILVYYVFWNFLGNTWGQFQTFIFVNADATQSMATGIGLAICFVNFLASLLVPAVGGTRFEKPLFYLGGALVTGSLAVLALWGDQLIVLVIATTTLTSGLQFAGEAYNKVWIQTSFADNRIRTTVQGFVLAVSRILCSLLALFTPALVVPGTIKLTMLVFLGFAVIYLVAGLRVLALRQE